MVRGLGGGGRPRAAVGSVRVEAVVAGVRTIPGSGSDPLTAPEKNPLFQIDSQI